MPLEDMPTTTYKDPRLCECGYSSIDPSNWSKHKKRCTTVTTGDKERIASLEKENEDLKQQLATQLLAKGEHYQNELAAKDRLIEELIKLSKKPITVNRRTKLPEPKRRKIAARQDWKCANPDGNCNLKGELEEYDVDHIIPLMRGGLDNESNMQAICPACHRRKTENDNYIKISDSDV